MCIRDRLYTDGECAIYYLMVGNDNQEMLAKPDGVDEGIINGVYKLRESKPKGAKHHVNLFGSGAIMPGVLKAQEILAEKYGVSSDVYSVTSYTQLRRDADECARWNMLHPTKKPKESFLDKTFKGVKGPFVAASDYVKALSEQVAQFLPGPMLCLGTDGMGRSETRPALRRHFEVDAEFVTIGALHQLKELGELDAKAVAAAIKDLDVDPDKISPLYA